MFLLNTKYPEKVNTVLVFRFIIPMLEIQWIANVKAISCVRLVLLKLKKLEEEESLPFGPMNEYILQ